MTTVLIVEDEESLAEPLAFLLGKEGFTVLIAGDGPTALDEFANNDVDIVLLDLMLPGMSGTDVCRQLRKTSTVPVIMVTARDSEVDKVVGLELGADDYVTKPYSSRELIARIRAVLRRGGDADHEPEPNPSVLGDGRVRMDLERHTVTVDGVDTPGIPAPHPRESAHPRATHRPRVGRRLRRRHQNPRRAHQTHPLQNRRRTQTSHPPCHRAGCGLQIRRLGV